MFIFSDSTDLYVFIYLDILVLFRRSYILLPQILDLFNWNLFSLIFFCLNSKIIEDLLQCSLWNRVFTNVIILLNIFHHSKKISDRIRISAHLNFPWISIMLNDLELIELLLHELNSFISLVFSKLPFHEFRIINLLLSLNCFIKIFSFTIRRNLWAKELIILSLQIKIATL